MFGSIPVRLLVLALVVASACGSDEDGDGGDRISGPEEQIELEGTHQLVSIDGDPLPVHLSDRTIPGGTCARWLVRGSIEFTTQRYAFALDYEDRCTNPDYDEQWTAIVNTGSYERDGDTVVFVFTVPGEARLYDLGSGTLAGGSLAAEMYNQDYSFDLVFAR